MPTYDELRLLQKLPLDMKIKRTQQRIREWVNHYGENGVYISFSGGKDSTVLLHIARQLYPNITAVFSDTGLELPSIRNFVMAQPNVTIIKPKLNFREVVLKHGYPLFSKEVSHAIFYARKIRGDFTPPSTYIKSHLDLSCKGFWTKKTKTLETKRQRDFCVGKRKGADNLRFLIKQNICLLASNSLF